MQHNTDRKSILITRPAEQSAELMQQLQERGHHVICESLTEIFLQHTARLALEKALQREPDAVLLTSPNGARALGALTELRDLMLLCVGEATADAARSVGFERIAEAGGNAESLQQLVEQAYDEGAYFVYLCAEHVRRDMASDLSQAGMEVVQIVGYSAVASEKISDTTLEQLRRGLIDAVTFFSQRSAEIFLAHARAAALQDTLPALTAYCLSDAVAAPLKAHGWQKIVVAKEPTLASLCQSVDNG